MRKSNVQQSTFTFFPTSKYPSFIIILDQKTLNRTLHVGSFEKANNVSILCFGSIDQIISKLFRWTTFKFLFTFNNNLTFLLTRDNGIFLTLFLCYISNVRFFLLFFCVTLVMYAHSSCLYLRKILLPSLFVMAASFLLFFVLH